jgi:organic radical activating enzyme
MDRNKVRDELNTTGCGFCLAKWTQVTIHLQLGRTHSCHHPDTHIIPLSELKRNPSALHNTSFKKEKRKEMLEGKRPSECQYCWNVEDNSNEFSDRIFKSSEPWSLPYLEEIKETNWRQDFNPRYVEVAFSNTCNFKCSYCGPSFSSQWVQESERYGGYPTTSNFNDLEYFKREGRMPFKSTDPNPYVDAFWKWWPDLYRDLDTFRITGGEPLLSKDTWGVLDYIIEEKNPNRNLHLAINTNLGVPDNLIDKFIEKINKIEDEQRAKDIVIYTSVDGWGEQAEYIRNGLIFNKFWDNMNKILSKCPTVTIGIMSTYNALSVTSYDKLINGVYNLKKEFASTQRAWTTPVSLDASYLRYPQHQTVQVLPMSFSETVKSHADLATSYEEIFHVNLNDDGVSYGFTQMEIPKIKRIYDWMITPQDEKMLNVHRKDFYNFFNEHDIRRGTNFGKTFPELNDFYNNCKEIKI